MRLAVLGLVVACASPAAAQNHFTFQVTQPNTSYQDSTHYNFVATSDMPYLRPVAPFGGCAPFTAELTAAPSGMVIREHTRRPGNVLSGPAGVFHDQAFELYWASPTAVGAPHTVTIRLTDCDGSVATSTFSLAVSTTRYKYFNSASGSDSNTCSFASPCQTLAACYNAAKVGASDICVFRTGTYHVAGVGLPTSGSGDMVHVDWNSHDSRGTQFMAYYGETATIDFDYAFTGTPVNHIWLQAEAAVVDGLTLDNAYHQGFRINRWSGGATVHNTNLGDIGQGIGGSNSGWFLWARGMSSGDTLIGNTTVDSGSIDHDTGNIIAKFYDVRYSVVAYNYCAANSNSSSDGCIAPKGGLDQFSHRGNMFTGTQRAWYGDLANDDGAPAIPSRGELAFNLFLMSDANVCAAIGNRGGAEVVGSIYVYRNTFRCKFQVQNLTSDDEQHYVVQNVHDNTGGTGGSCPTPLSCSGVADYTKLTQTNDYDAASSDLDANGSLQGTALTTHGPSSGTPKGHLLSNPAAPPVTGVYRLRFR